MKNLDIVIRESGLLEKFGCTADDIKYTYSLYQDYWSAGSKMRSLPMDYRFLETLEQMGGSLSQINEMLVRQNEDARRHELDMEVKRAAGTLDEYLNECEAKMPNVGAFLEAFGRAMPPNPNLTRSN